MPKSDLTQALTAIEPKTKAAKVREVMPVIEQRIAAGVRIADILKTLKDSGIDLTEATLKSYLYRYRRKHQAKTKGQQSASRTVGMRHHLNLANPNLYRTKQIRSKHQHLAARSRCRSLTA